MIEPIKVSLDSLNLGTLAPMVVALIGALSIILIDLFSKNKDKSLYVILVVLFLVFDLFTLLAYSGDSRGVFDLLLVDGISVLSQVIIICASILFIFLSMSKLRFQELRYAEYFALYLFMIAAFQFMVSSDSLILIYVALETASLCLYTMIAMNNRSLSIEASIKYFSMGALAGAFFVFGSMLFYAITGSVELAQISLYLGNEDYFNSASFSNYMLLLVAFVFIFAALAFKLSLFPFHTWVPDVYQGSTSALAGFMSIVPKMAAFIVALRFFEIFVNSGDMIIYVILYIAVVLTMTIPNIIALQQRDIKRMLAYSSISNAGLAMAAILIGTTQSTQGLFLYWILFTVTNFGAFGMIWINRQKGYDNYITPYSIENFSGLAQKSPFTASIFGLFLFALTGLPPFALFWGKLYLVSSAVNAGELILAVIIILNAVIASYYYLKPISYMFLRDPDDKFNKVFLANASIPIKTAIAFCVFLTITSIFYIEPLLQIISYYISSAGF